MHISFPGVYGNLFFCGLAVSTVVLSPPPSKLGRLCLSLCLSVSRITAKVISLLRRFHWYSVL